MIPIEPVSPPDRRIPPADRTFDTDKPMPEAKPLKFKIRFWEKYGFKNAQEWTLNNTVKSKTFWGVMLILISPVTGPFAPGVIKAGELLIVVGLGHKAIKNWTGIGAAVGGLISGLRKKKQN